MQFRKMLDNKLTVAVRIALSVGTFAIVGPALAQDATGPASQDNAKKLETVTVTGSRIPRVDIETAQPVVTIDRKQIENQGFTSVADILQNLTEVGTPPISRANALSSGEDVGGYYIDLRNLGANRTLILVNGKRLGANTSGLQDLGQIPVSTIERIEVLKDGGSSIYGSDAIAGVVNVITRSNFTGAEANAYVGEYDQGDGKKQSYDFTFGTANDRGSIMVSAQYQKEDPVWAKDRDFSAYPSGPNHPTAGWSGVSQNGSFTGPCGPGGKSATCTLTHGTDPRNIANYHPITSAEYANSNEQMTLQTGTERTSLFAAGKYNLSDNIAFKTDFLYNKRSTLQQIAGYPYQSSSWNPKTPLSGQSYFNPLGKDLQFARRGWEMPRTTDSELETYRWTAGFEGYFELGGRTWNWDVGAMTNRNDMTKTGHGDFSLVAAGKALGPSFMGSDGKVHCGTAANPIAGCVPWNPLLPYGQAGAGSLADSDLQSFLFPEFHDLGKTTTTDYTANIAGTLFALPAGEIGVAAGVEHRQEDGRFVPDAFNQAGLSSGLAATTTKGKYSVDEAYIEFDVPLLKDMTMARELSVDVATRYSNYDNFGSTTNSKASLKWKPIDDLLVRGSWAQGFRAPTISDLYGGAGSSFESYIDPCDTKSGAAKGNPAVAARCTGGFGGQTPVAANFVQLGQAGIACTTYPCQTNYAFTNGSNANLTPETATTRTLGLIYSPHYVEGFDVSLDWYKIRIENVISTDSVQNILDDCYQAGIASRCSGFSRDASTGVITNMFYGLTNKGWEETAGYDFGVNYRFSFDSIGQFATRWNTTYVDYLNVKSDNNPSTKVQPFTGMGANFRVRSNLTVDWTRGIFGASWTVRYYSGMTEKCVAVAMAECNDPNHIDPFYGVQPMRHVASTTFNDVQFRWTLPWKGIVSVGANNVFDKEGPIMYSKPNSSFVYYGGFDIGRFYYLKYTQRF
ncbi:TonB-dependent receptor plug domain-containing protein [Dyella jiangningensis]|uniref:TonB-dependent receptor n=1 Tax=Dyella jiangningensis TaxID=1379159 RepID=A0A328P2S8_9GAMM|nr:TonB-dependent receptor [Dyella jiangningensis]RAO76478.1 TonB-dependent receptor [Dyella jiangningensis]